MINRIAMKNIVAYTLVIFSLGFKALHNLQIMYAARSVTMVAKTARKIMYMKLVFASP